MSPKYTDLLPRAEDGLLTAGSVLAATGGCGGTGVKVPDDLCCGCLMANCEVLILEWKDMDISN